MYHILYKNATYRVRRNKPASKIAEKLLTLEQVEMYWVYLEISGNRKLESDKLFFVHSLYLIY